MCVWGPLGPQFSALQTSRHCLKSGSLSPTEAWAVPAQRIRSRIRETAGVQSLPVCGAMAAASTGGRKTRWEERMEVAVRCQGSRWCIQLRSELRTPTANRRVWGPKLVRYTYVPPAFYFMLCGWR